MRRTAVLAGVGSLALAAIIGLGQPAAAATTSKVNVIGTLTAMSGTVAPVTMTVTAGATTYTVNVTSATMIQRKFNGTSNLGEFVIGDSVQVWGTLSNDVANTLAATRIRDLSIQRMGGTFTGSIVTLSCSTNSFTYKPDKRVQQTVNLATTTKITRGGEKVTCADLMAGERAKVIGVWNSKNNTITADRVVVDMKTISGTIASIVPSDGTLPAALTVTLKNGTTWTVNIASTTKLFRNYMKSATISELLVGDKVEARGTVSTGNVLSAKVVRDTSITTKNSDFQGKVLSVDTTAMTFVLQINGKVDGTKFTNVTVTTTTATKYVDENGMRAFSDVSAGDKVKVLGTLTLSTKTLAATRVFFKTAQ